LEELKDFHNENYYCPDTQELIIQGNWHAPVFGTFTLKFHRCSNDSKSGGYTPNVTCAEDLEFNEWIRPITLQEIVVSSYADTSDFVYPIHYFLDDIWVSLVPGRTVVYQTFIKKDLLKLNDDYFGLFADSVTQFFFERSRNDYFTADLNLF
jgi:hypothetical protein